jgi:hypothetical protein
MDEEQMSNDFENDIREAAREEYFKGNKKKAFSILKSQLNMSNDEIRRLFNLWETYKEAKSKETKSQGNPEEIDKELYEKLKKESSETRRREPINMGKGKKFKRPRIPLFRSQGVDQRRDIVWTIILLIVGMVISAIIGSMWIFFAFLSLAAYVLVPGPEEMIGKNLEKIRRKYNKAIAKASPEEAKRLEAVMKEDLENARTIKRIQTREGVMKWGTTGVKYLFKAGFFVFFSLGFITSAIPLFKPLGILIAFIGYFMEG